MILPTNPTEQQQLATLWTAMDKAQREFAIYFTAFCASRGIAVATFKQLTPNAVEAEVPTDD